MSSQEGPGQQHSASENQPQVPRIYMKPERLRVPSMTDIQHARLVELVDQQFNMQESDPRWKELDQLMDIADKDLLK